MLRTLALATALSAGSLLAQAETDLFTIAQSGIGSNGFGTVWRGQDIELAEDAWLTRIVFSTGSASANVAEMRLMTSGTRPTTLRATTTINTLSNIEVEGVLGEPYLLRGGVRYTIWFRQTGTPRGTAGCDFQRVDPTWGGYHTNVDPTLAPAAGESSIWWGYRYGTNCRLIGYDNMEVGGSDRLGGVATFTLTAGPIQPCVVLFSGGTTDQPVPGLTGPLRLSLASIVTPGFLGVTDASGVFANALTIPNDPNLVGLALYTQGAYDPSFTRTATLTPLDVLRIR